MNQPSYSILLIDDDEDDFFLMRARLHESPMIRYQVEWASSFEAGQTAMARNEFDAVLVDYRMGANTGVDLIREAMARNYPAPIILLTGQGNYEVDMEAMQAGAADYLNKSEISSHLLDRSIRYAIERKHSEAALRRSEQALRESEGRFRVALSNVAIAVFSTDIDLRYTWFYSTAMGSLPDHFIGKRDDEIMPEGNAQALLDVKRRVLKERAPVRDEIVVALTGHPMTMMASVEPYFDSRGEMIGVIGALYDVTEQRQMERERIEHTTEMEVQRRLTEFREQERQAIAREIHDGPVQDLSGLIFRLQYVQGSLQDPALKAEFGDIQVSVQATVNDLREMMNELRPPSLIRFGLARAIQNHLEGFQEKHPELAIESGIEAVDEKVQLEDQVKLNMYHIYHEALNNVIQHAQATRVLVQLQLKDQHLLLVVKDDGVGLFGPVDLIDSTQNNHYGLAGMLERANLISGELQVSSEHGQGTVVQVSVPVER